MSYESDERYWTDYLRVALPVVGLLLMLGLLFWWANSIIGDEQGTQPTSTVAATESQVATAETSTPVNTVEAGVTPEPVDTATTEPGGGDGTEEPGGGDDPTEEPVDCESDFALNDPATVREDIRFRNGANFDQDAPPLLLADSEVEITNECFELVENPDDNNEEVPFRRVRVLLVPDGSEVEEGEQGFVSEEFLDPAE